MKLKIQHAFVWAICALFLHTVPSEAQQKVRQDKDPKPSMACSSECGKQHGTGKKKGEAYNSRAYESCMVECMREAKKNTRKPAKK